jgi:hypothetical protein
MPLSERPLMPMGGRTVESMSPAARASRLGRLDLVVIAGASAIVASQVGFLGVSAGSALIQSLPALMGRHAACGSDTTVVLDSQHHQVCIPRSTKVPPGWTVVRLPSAR